jgi:hypothetical protein
MELLEDVAEAAVVGAFLRAELHSPRYRSTVLSLLRQAGASPGLIEDPNLADAQENDVRARILGAYRGWPDRFLFHRFPGAVRWRRAVLTHADLGAVLYINDDPRLPGHEGWSRVSWSGLAAGTRLVADGAKTVGRGRPEPGYEPMFSNILATAGKMRAGTEYPELILARPSITSPLLIIEGHTRATAYVLAGCERVPAFVGEAPGLERWHLS